MKNVFVIMTSSWIMPANCVALKSPKIFIQNKNKGSISFFPLAPRLIISVTWHTARKSGIVIMATQVQVGSLIRGSLSSVPVLCCSLDWCVLWYLTMIWPHFFPCVFFFFVMFVVAWSVESLLLVETSTLFHWQHGESQILALKMRGESTVGPISAWSFSKSGLNWGLKVLLFKCWTNIIHRNQMSAHQMIEWLRTDEGFGVLILTPLQSLCWTDFGQDTEPPESPKA